MNGYIKLPTDIYMGKHKDLIKCDTVYLTLDRPKRVSEISRMCGLKRDTVDARLETLIDYEYVTVDDKKRYSVIKERVKQSDTSFSYKRELSKLFKTKTIACASVYAYLKKRNKDNYNVVSRRDLCVKLNIDRRTMNKIITTLEELNLIVIEESWVVCTKVWYKFRIEGNKINAL